MPAPLALIAGWARSAVVPRGGAFGRLPPHEIAAPVLRALLARAGLAPEGVDAVVMGNALGAGGNPARLVALAAGLPERCAAYSVDTQCCAGLDAVSLGVGLLASGQASVVLAGGVEAWSRAPIRMHRPLQAGEAPVAYERPAFAPDPQRDPDLLAAAADHALRHGYTREQQDAYAVHSHQRALAHQARLMEEIVPVAGVGHDPYPRALDPARVARMPAVVRSQGEPDCDLSTVAISAQADGAALVLLATPQACERLGLRPRAAWIAGATLGANPQQPLAAAQIAATEALRRSGTADAGGLHAIELHDAFAVQGLDFCRRLALEPGRINRRGGGLARGHPIGASASIALVRLLADLAGDAAPGERGLVAVAGAGGIGAAAVVERR